MPSAAVVLSNPAGLHARPAATFAMAANRFTAQVQIEKGGRRVDAKSVLKLIALNCGSGETVTIHTSGADQDAALFALVELVRSGLGE